MKAYEEDLAYIHDKGFGWFAERSAPGLLDLIGNCGITKGKVVDLGCGSGIWASALTHAGYKVFGIEISASMLGIARQKAPKAQFRQASMFEVDLPRCNVVTAIGECLSYRIDQRNANRAIGSLFSQVYNALRPGGVFIFDVLRQVPRKGQELSRSWYAGSDWAVLVETRPHGNGCRITREITSFRKIGESYRRSHERHELVLHRSAELCCMLRELGFRVRYLAGYGKQRFSTGHVGVLARRPN